MKEFYQSRGKLGEILEEYQAPSEARASIMRRAVLVVARGQLPIEKVDATITKSMSANGGLPKWDEVTEKIGEQVTDVYRKSRRFR